MRRRTREQDARRNSRTASARGGRAARTRPAVARCIGRPGAGVLAALLSAAACVHIARAEEAVSLSIIGKSGRLDVPVSAGIEVTISDRFRPGEPGLAVRLPKTLAGELCALSKRHVGSTVEIRVGCEAISRPLVREPICGGSFIVSGTMTPADAEALAARIRTGSQPCRTPTN